MITGCTIHLMHCITLKLATLALHQQIVLLWLLLANHT